MNLALHYIRVLIAFYRLFKPHLVRTQRKLPQFQILFSLSEVFPPQDISAIGLSALLFIQLNGEMRKNSKINKNKNFSPQKRLSSKLMN